jgi:hypothetical protein
VAIVESPFSLRRMRLARYSSTVSSIAPVLTRHTRHKMWTEDYSCFEGLYYTIGSFHR